MKSKMSTEDMSEKKSWFSRMKVAIAAFAFAGALIAGGAVVVDDAPDAQAEEVAWGHGSFNAGISWW